MFAFFLIFFDSDVMLLSSEFSWLLNKNININLIENKKCLEKSVDLQNINKNNLKININNKYIEHLLWLKKVFI